MRNLGNLPAIISYPRSGSHMLNCALELYSGRSRVFRPQRGPIYCPTVSLLDRPAEPLWVQTHDPDCPPVPTRYVLLTRNPVDTLHSYAAVRGVTRTEQIGRWVEQYAGEWAWHLYRWERGAEAVIDYEQLAVDSDAMRPAVELLGLQWDAAEARRAWSAATKEQLSDHAPAHLTGYFHRGLLAPDYAISREAFRQKYGPIIRAAIIRTREGIEAALQLGAY